MVLLETAVTKLLGVEHPVVMGGMTGTGTPELAAAVSNAGGLGVFAAHNAGSPEGAREWIRRMRTLTSKPFGVNLTILPTMGPPPPYEEYAQVIIEEGVKVVETAGSNPKKWIQLFKSAGLVTIHKCVAVRHALSAERAGVDIVSMDGFEVRSRPAPSTRLAGATRRAHTSILFHSTPCPCLCLSLCLLLCYRTFTPARPVRGSPGRR